MAAVGQSNGAVFPGGFNIHRRIRLLCFQKGAVGAAVRGGQPIGAEISLVRFLAEVPAVAVVDGPVLGAEPNGVIRPLPDAPAAETVAAVKNIPVPLQIAAAVSHCVAVFANEQRPLFVGAIQKLLKPLVPRVHFSV